jgi:hypothetical protein
MSVELKRFSDSEIRLSQEQAWRILRFFWPDTSILPGELTQDDVSFAQALLLEAIDSSYHMGYVEHLFKSFYMKVPASWSDVEDMVKGFAKASLKHWFKHATQADLANPQIYETVRRTLAWKFVRVWQIRQTTGELTY